MPTLELHRLGAFDVNLWSDGEGAGDAPPLLFLHGYERHPGGASFLRRLAGGRRVLAPEQPGYGSSTGLEHIHDQLDLVLFYRELIESWDAGPVDVVGHSLGGMIAAELGAICPQVVRRLVLVDAFGLWLDDEPTLDPFGAAEELLAAKWHDPAAAPDPEPTIFEPDPEDPHAAIFFQAQNLATATKFLWPIADRGLRRRLGLIDAPTLVVHGASDGLLPMSYAEELVRLIPDARLAPIERAGHYPMLEREDEFVSVVESFLAE
jgi:pimeloyl-ACP methyl ester carboxylesterase